MIAFLILTTLSFGQTLQPDKIVIRVSAAYKPANIELTKGHIQISSIQTLGGKLTFKGFETGYYKLTTSGREKSPKVTDSIFVKKGQLLELNIMLEDPCLYDYSTDQIPVCPENHTDNVIPIVYGLIAQSSGSDLKNEKIHLGGCLVTDCDPKFYCTIHKVEF